MTFEDYGIIGVKPNLRTPQHVKCPKCKHTARTPTDCLTVWTETGTWSCNKCFWGKGLSLRGSSTPTFRPAAPRSPLAAPTDDMYTWFASRGITREVVDRNKVSRTTAYFPQVQKELSCVAFAYYVGDTLINCKYRSKKKDFTQIKGADRTFYKINDAANSDSVIICEGEIDALSFEVAGFANAISVPDGAPNPEAKNLDTKLAFLDAAYPYLQHIERFYLATDSDAPGLRLREELARRLGKDRCWIVRFPDGCKDANDVLVKHNPQTLAECVESAEPYPIEGAISAESRFEHLTDLWENGFPEGASTSWEGFNQLMRFYGGQLTVITGVPGSGKSTWLDNLSVQLSANAGWRWAMFTPENHPIEIHQMRLAEIIIGRPFLPSYNNQMDREHLEGAKHYISEHFSYIVPQNEMFTLSGILGVATYYVRAKGIKGLVIDPWNTIEHQRSKELSETEYVALALNQIKYWAQNHGVHAFVVAHPRKMESKAQSDVVAGFANYEIPTLYSISGSANWFNVPDNGIVVHRTNHEGGWSESHVYVQKVKHKFIGKTGVAPMKFNVACSRFDELLGGHNGANF